VATPNTPSSIPTGVETAGANPSVAQMAEKAVGGIQSSIPGLGLAALGYGFAALLFKRGAEALFLQKNPFRGVGKKE
jgi:hypothetical protein